ncbi:ferredoxin [Saccharothrix algeriensis]|uniref:Ferredoxin n=1 Tax=Saccharothrix algeriensis TaxID=173560 RepID=A0A0R5ZY91_9PSEU|nr:ferredoxin [Saccharothrix algeriensis]AJI44173.1 ferredoxin [Saccharothrix algeriensis]MBM7815122.1 ferredoxin [Saccharothrix algeriensis]QTR03371.1 ferredoxin [Saccharothrix algeriensis]
MKITVDEDKCCGAGMCALAAPEVFDQRIGDGVVVVLDAEPAEHLHESVREAVEVCPVAAITLTLGADA